MTIHHATVKKAAKSGILLTEIDSANGTVAQALHAAMNVRFEHTDPKEAVAATILACIFKAEWPNLTLTLQGGTWVVTGVDADGEEVVVWTGDEIPMIGEIMDATHDVNVDPEQGIEDEEEETRKAVVPEKYKAEYAERGNRDHCGDWIAKKLDGLFNTDDGKFDPVAFEQFLTLNDVDMSGKWASLPTSGQKGWVGRYRMNGRQKLEMKITEKGGFKYNNGGEIQFHEPSQAYLEFLAAKHPKVTPIWATKAD
jgi:hypothetical protein